MDTVSSLASRRMPGVSRLFNKCLLIDFVPWLAPFPVRLMTKLEPMSASRIFSLLQLSAAFGIVARDPDFGVFRPSSFSSRHGGASVDPLSRRLPAVEVKMWGQWRSDASLPRCGKDLRLLGNSLS
eukprot:12695315-Heterocapsa_arctica.AAC.1